MPFALPLESNRKFCKCDFQIDPGFPALTIAGLLVLRLFWS